MPLFSIVLSFILVGCGATKQLEAQSVPVVPFNLWESSNEEDAPEVDLDFSAFTMAKFPSGDQAMMEYLMLGHEIHSDSLLQAGIRRTDLTVLCDIDTSGKAVNIRISAKPNSWDHMYPPMKMAESMAMEIVDSMPLWKPARLHGKKAIETGVPLRVAIIVK